MAYRKTKTTKLGNTKTKLSNGASVTRTPDGATHFKYTRKGDGRRVTIRTPGRNGQAILVIRRTLVGKTKEKCFDEHSH